MNEITIDIALLEEIIAPEMVEIEQNAYGNEYDYLRGYSQARKDIWATISKIVAAEEDYERKLSSINSTKKWAKHIPDAEAKKELLAEIRGYEKSLELEHEAGRLD